MHGFVICIVILGRIWATFASIPQALQTRLGTCGKVHLTVSPLKDNYLELNWVTRGCDVDSWPDFIILSTQDLRTRDEDRFSSILVQVRPTDYPDDFYKTTVKFREPWLPGNWEYDANTVRADVGSHCFPFWITSIKYDRIIDSRCLEIQPTWMYDNRDYLGHQRIGNVFIPGTHNSGSHKGILAMFEGYVLNQDRSVWTQLVFGIRYLDLRIGYTPEGELFIFHDHIKVTRVEPVLREIRKFVELAPQEVIIVDIHRFPFPRNFTKPMHDKFISLLKDTLGDFVLSPNNFQKGEGPTFNEIWALNKSIIISYADSLVINSYPWLWLPIKQFWGNTNKVAELKAYLLRSISELKISRNPLWALMAELTPQTWDVILRKNNLRQLSQSANKQVTKWFRDEWFNEANIVASDYFLGNDLIRVAIEGNNAKSVL